MKILVTGGAGYIGAHMAKWLARAGHEVVIFDNLSTGFRFLARYGTLFEGDLNRPETIERCLEGQAFDAVIHFAARSLVGESVQNPLLYYQNNVSGTVNLLAAMDRAGVRRLIFSSTAATYGNPQSVPIPETAPTRPINPYGRSKRMMEQVIEDAVAAYSFDAVSLRYFNAAGADPEGELGECHDPETHLIPLVLQAALGKRPAVTIYGEDYPTPDGTCVRDYIHVWDLVAAHDAALSALMEDRVKGYDVFNLGIGHGYSVKEVIEVCQRVVAQSGCRIPVQVGPRRPGDPAELVADSRKAQRVLQWRAHHSDLETIVRHAWAWTRRYLG
ncbi:UDP-glucose 4-epimerase [Sulfurivirga caldicuralii]|uniref:UDP-glucose 4-epimerase n=1 Tax=Sulfurivirga caldicuralii TaxID=364032 RepID=A0A1N6HBU8_9GAMM|nr:UDP-glucose 4-epimerase GalE [Sulfurivirga caldicuralii]SIO17177.1 UDP-glucose 4-epimerase [Sulfurivirga caldicuralii]